MILIQASPGTLGLAARHGQTPKLPASCQPVLRAAVNVVFTPPLTEETLKALFTKPYGAPAPTAEQWRAVYDEAVHFQNPTQEKSGIEAYIVAQEGLIRRCDEIFLEPGAVALSGETAFVEWTMGLKIKGIEFVYPGTTRLRIGPDGKIVEHRDYFDFVGPTFEPVPVVGGFVRWLYRRFVS